MNPDHQPLQISELVASIQSLTEAAQSKAALLAEQGRKLIALAKEALAASVQRWHDAGVCLQALDRPGMPQALGFETYYALCHKELNLAPTSVRTLVRVSKAFSAEQCSTLGVDRAEALLTLANVTQGGAVAKVLAGTPIELWSGGPQLQVASASVAELRAATKAARAQGAQAAAAARAATGAAPTSPKRGPRGRTVSVAERARAAELNQRLRSQGSQAQVRAIATRPGRPARFSLEGLALAELEAAVAAVPRIAVAPAVREPA